MKVYVFRSGRCVAGAVVLAALLATGGVHAAEYPEIPSEESAPERDDMAADDKTSLDALYRRLENAKSAKRAKVIAQRIERQWLESGSPTTELLISRAMVLTRAEQYDPALALLDAVVVAAPDFAEAWNRRAMVHFQKRDFRAALSDLQRVLSLEPRHFRAMQGLAAIFTEFGDKARALAIYQRLLEVYPQQEEARDAVEDLQPEVEGQDI
jgi:tetratricopeptide (TPR) repeat protein